MYIIQLHTQSHRVTRGILQDRDAAAEVRGGTWSNFKRKDLALVQKPNFCDHCINYHSHSVY